MDQFFFVRSYRSFDDDHTVCFITTLFDFRFSILISTMNVTRWSVLFLVVSAADWSRCSSTCSHYSRRPKPEYHLTKECASSTMRTLATSNAAELDSCAALATARNAFAFTYVNQTAGPVIFLYFLNFSFIQKHSNWSCSKAGPTRLVYSANKIDSRYAFRMM